MTIEQSHKIQCLRGIAIIGVLCIHTLPGGNWQVYVRPLVNYAVALFLFLSGLLTKVDYDDWGGFMRKRVTRVLIPYIIWTILYTLPEQSFKLYLYNLLLGQATPFLYFILVYIQFVLLTPLLGKLASSKYKWIGFLIAPLATVGYTYSKVFLGYQPSHHLDALWGASCLGWMGYYYLGLLLGNHLIQAPRKWLPLLTLYLLSIPLQMGEGYVWYYGYGANYCGTQIKLTSFITSSIFLLLSYLYIQDNRVIFSPTWLRKIGDCSFGIYLVHGVVMSLFSIYTSWYGVLIFGLNTILVLLSSLLIVVLTKYIFGPMGCRYIGFT